MGFFNHCITCKHIEEEHATDAPEGEQECMHENEDGTLCTCENYEWDGE